MLLILLKDAGEFKAAFEKAQKENAAEPAVVADEKPADEKEIDSKPSEDPPAQPESVDSTKPSEGQAVEEKSSAPE